MSDTSQVSGPIRKGEPYFDSFVILVLSTGGPLALMISNAETVATVKLGAAIGAVLFTGLVAPLVSSATADGS